MRVAAVGVGAACSVDKQEEMATIYTFWTQSKHKAKRIKALRVHAKVES